MRLFDLFYPEFCKSDMSRYGYLKVFQRVPWTLNESGLYTILLYELLIWVWICLKKADTYLYTEVTLNIHKP